MKSETSHRALYGHNLRDSLRAVSGAASLTYIRMTDAGIGVLLSGPIPSEIFNTCM